MTEEGYNDDIQHLYIQTDNYSKKRRLSDNNNDNCSKQLHMLNSKEKKSLCLNKIIILSPEIKEESSRFIKRINEGLIDINDEDEYLLNKVKISNKDIKIYNSKESNHIKNDTSNNTVCDIVNYQSQSKIPSKAPSLLKYSKYYNVKSRIGKYHMYK